MRVHDIDVDLVTEICNYCNLQYSLSNYLVFRKKENEGEEIFCFSGSDIIGAMNIIGFMTRKNDGYNYYYSEELASMD